MSRAKPGGNGGHPPVKAVKNGRYDRVSIEAKLERTSNAGLKGLDFSPHTLELY